MRAWLLLFSLLPGLALAEACVVHSQAERLDVKVCQENRNIPATLFREGFCQPQLQGQTVEVEFVAQCPKGAHGVCQNARAVCTCRTSTTTAWPATRCTWSRPARRSIRASGSSPEPSAVGRVQPATPCLAGCTRPTRKR